MPSRRTTIKIIGSSICATLVGCEKPQGRQMPAINFDLGKNINETAKTSGAPRFQVSKTAGLIDYSVNNLPDSIEVRYMRPGYEVVWQPIFAFTMYADEDHFPDQRVETADLQLSTKNFQTHEAAQALVENTINQFQHGSWKRYHDPEWDVLLTGRSSILDEHGAISRSLRTIDPSYKIPKADWVQVVKGVAKWRWVGDGVLATLDVNGNEDTHGIDYQITMTFTLLEVALKIDAENLARKLKEGDNKGWKSTENHKIKKKENAELNNRLINNAIKRGDSVLQKP